MINKNKILKKMGFVCIKQYETDISTLSRVNVKNFLLTNDLETDLKIHEDNSYNFGKSLNTINKLNGENDYFKLDNKNLNRNLKLSIVELKYLRKNNKNLKFKNIEKIYIILALVVSNLLFMVN